MGCDLAADLGYDHELLFQSTHPRGVRLKRDAKIWEDFLISIHAPTWGATPYEFRQPPRWLFISIHAPTWGATPESLNSASLENFNPRTHVGCDTARPWCGPSPPYFNPRTPVGCDFNDSKMMENYIDFNPRTHVGCDLASSVALIISSRFQSTHPRGVRPSQSYSSCVILLFQSTHPRGVRQRACPADLHSNKISIHAPTWGATTVQMLVDHRERFQSTHPRGVRPRCRVRHPG